MTTVNQLDSALPDVGFLRLPQVLALLPIGRSTWWLWVKQGRAPAPVKLSERVTAWRASDVRALLERLSAQEAS